MMMVMLMMMMVVVVVVMMMHEICFVDKCQKWVRDKNWLRFWDIFPGHVQNDLKTIGYRLLRSGLIFFFFCKISKMGADKNLFTLLGNVSRSSAE